MSFKLKNGLSLSLISTLALMLFIVSIRAVAADEVCYINNSSYSIYANMVGPYGLKDQAQYLPAGSGVENTCNLFSEVDGGWRVHFSLVYGGKEPFLTSFIPTVTIPLVGYSHWVSWPAYVGIPMESLSPDKPNVLASIQVYNKSQRCVNGICKLYIIDGHG